MRPRRPHVRWVPQTAADRQGSARVSADFVADTPMNSLPQGSVSRCGRPTVANTLAFFFRNMLKLLGYGYVHCNVRPLYLSLSERRFRRLKNSVSPGAMAAAIIAVVLILGVVAWRVFSGSSAGGGGGKNPYETGGAPAGMTPGQAPKGPPGGYPGGGPGGPGGGYPGGPPGGGGAPAPGGAGAPAPGGGAGSPPGPGTTP